MREINDTIMELLDQLKGEAIEELTREKQKKEVEKEPKHHDFELEPCEIKTKRDFITNIKDPGRLLEVKVKFKKACIGLRVIVTLVARIGCDFEVRTIRGRVCECGGPHLSEEQGYEDERHEFHCYEDECMCGRFVPDDPCEKFLFNFNDTCERPFCAEEEVELKAIANYIFCESPL